ncbi:hypothetical protein T492DRAFT_1008503 [Pavlovales sp. CCMP2436]|nr:hypothetical protein T492DRAFT_1008503 [Pavlovales sp. CCMP2436]
MLPTFVTRVEVGELTQLLQEPFHLARQVGVGKFLRLRRQSKRGGTAPRRRHRVRKRVQHDADSGPTRDDSAAPDDKRSQRHLLTEFKLAISVRESVNIARVRGNRETQCRTRRKHISALRTSRVCEAPLHLRRLHRCQMCTPRGGCRRIDNRALRDVQTRRLLHVVCLLVAHVHVAQAKPLREPGHATPH